MQPLCRAAGFHAAAALSLFCLLAPAAQAQPVPAPPANSEAARQQFVGETYSSYFSAVSLIGFLLQVFVVSRVFKVFGVGRSLLIHPVVALVSHTWAGLKSIGSIL